MLPREILLVLTASFQLISCQAIIQGQHDQQQQIAFTASWHAITDDDSASRHPLPQPAGPLPWSHLNILSTTDTHGWVRGHSPYVSRPAPEFLYSADLGDLSSFISHIRRIGEVSKNADVLFVDAGDTLDGNGFVDGDTSGIKGHAARELLKKLKWDITTTGNHELYNASVARDVYRNFIPAFNGNYLASNVNISTSLAGVDDANTDTVPFGSRYTTLVTKIHKLQITAFGVLFNFDRADKGLHVQNVEDMVQEAWWLRVLKETKTDVFVIVGHMATYDEGWRVVQRNIRKVHPKTPILIFSGHAHVRDCKRLDPFTQVLAAGRYLESVGFTSLHLPHLTSRSTEHLDAAHSSKDEVRISRRYLDTNLATYTYHTNTSSTPEGFPTATGREIKTSMAAYARSFDLQRIFGWAPHSYFLNRYPTSHPASLINLYATKVFNSVLSPPPERTQTSVMPVFLFNTGAARFDIFKGAFTKDDQLAVVPFENAMWYLRDLKRELVDEVLEFLNRRGEPEYTSSRSSMAEQDAYNAMLLADSLQLSAIRRAQARVFARATPQNDQSHLDAARARAKLTYGYVTSDTCGPTPGDDTPHRPLPVFDIPDFVLSTRPEGSLSEAEDAVDLVFYEFIAPLVIDAVNSLQSHRKYGKEDVGLYSHLRANELLGEYAKKAWQARPT